MQNFQEITIFVNSLTILLTVIGIIVLARLIARLSKSSGAEARNESTQAAVPTQPLQYAQPAAKAYPLTTSDVTDTGELIAMVSAAIAAHIGTPVGSIKIASIKKTDGGAVIWNKVGQEELLS